MFFKRKKNKLDTWDDLVKYNSNTILDDCLYVFKAAFSNILTVTRFACFKLLSILTIPFTIIGLVGGFYLVKGIIYFANNNAVFADNTYFRKMLVFLVPYIIYVFLKEAFRYHGK